jgi:hypothetical protein
MRKKLKYTAKTVLMAREPSSEYRIQRKNLRQVISCDWRWSGCDWLWHWWDGGEDLQGHVSQPENGKLKEVEPVTDRWGATNNVVVNLCIRNDEVEVKGKLFRCSDEVEEHVIEGYSRRTSDFWDPTPLRDKGKRTEGQ